MARSVTQPVIDMWSPEGKKITADISQVKVFEANGYSRKPPVKKEVPAPKLSAAELIEKIDEAKTMEELVSLVAEDESRKTVLEAFNDKKEELEEEEDED